MNDRLIGPQEKHRNHMREIDSREVFHEIRVDIKFSTFFIVGIGKFSTFFSFLISTNQRHE